MGTIKETKNQNKPRKPISAYNIFFQAERQRLLGMAEGKKPDFRNLAKYVSAKWKRMTYPDKVEYVQKAIQDKKRYACELLEWHRLSEEGELCISNTIWEQTEAEKIVVADDPHQPLPFDPCGTEEWTPSSPSSVGTPHDQVSSHHVFASGPYQAQMIPSSPIQSLDCVDTFGSLHWVANQLGRDGVRLFVGMFSN
mmetsp:Transcript_5432/g.11098  ORF Transcript_5432/g.11098 Transcript_5432/m.11098 type:complete len:196 (+) Transcript_5432:140-727(+)|eukprot:scaffold4632_cov169-Amphora_coffeaeformis.AAC.1